MKIETLLVNDKKIANLISEDVFINSTDDALELLGNLYYQDYDELIIHKQNIMADFFNLKNGIAGEILQKYSTYWVQLAIVGDFKSRQANR